MKVSNDLPDDEWTKSVFQFFQIQMKYLRSSFLEKYIEHQLTSWIDESPSDFKFREFGCEALVGPADPVGGQQYPQRSSRALVVTS
jgi:hypothetical protein